jgi:hypothetical protein
MAGKVAALPRPVVAFERHRSDFSWVLASTDEGGSISASARIALIDSFSLHLSPVVNVRSIRVSLPLPARAQRWKTAVLIATGMNA